MFNYYDSFNTASKTPFGAVCSEEKITFNLCVPHHLGNVKPHLVLRKEGTHHCPVHYPMTFTKSIENINHYTFCISPKDIGLYFYHFDLYRDYLCIWRGSDGKGVLGTNHHGDDWQLTVYEKDFKTPDCLKGKVFYQIFPDRFYEGTVKKMPFSDRIYQADKTAEPAWINTEQGGNLTLDYYGGDISGIIKKLPYLQNLGVDFIYLNPIFEAHSNHRYNTADYLTVDPLLGTNEDFAKLCKLAKSYGIGIILDGVFSHTGDDSIYFNMYKRYGEGGAYHDKKSPYRKWYHFSNDYTFGYRSWWGFKTLPEVDETNAEFIDFITGIDGVIDTWIKLGAAGFRLDVADELPDDFIEKIRIAVKRHGDDKYLLGEVWEDATTKVAYDTRRTYLLGKGLDSVMNYPFKEAIINFLRSGNAQDSANAINSICENYPPPALHTLFNFLSTHDTERVLTHLMNEPSGHRGREWQTGRKLSEEKYEESMPLLKMAYAMLFTLPGLPSVYYGDEVAMQGYRDPFNRAYFEWNSTETRLKPVIEQLSQLRHSCEAFKTGQLQFVCIEHGFMHYKRIGEHETADIILNRTNGIKLATIDGKSVHINPMGFTITVNENGHNPDHSYYDIK